MDNDGGRDMLLTSQAMHKYRLSTAKSVIDNAPPKSCSVRPNSLKVRSSKRASNPDPSRMYSTLVKTTNRIAKTKKSKRMRPRSADVRKKRKGSRPRSSSRGSLLQSYEYQATKRARPQSGRIRRPTPNNNMFQVSQQDTLKSISDELDQLVNTTPRTRFAMNVQEKQLFNAFVNLLTKYEEGQIDEILEGAKVAVHEKKLLQGYGNPNPRPRDDNQHSLLRQYDSQVYHVEDDEPSFSPTHPSSPTQNDVDEDEEDDEQQKMAHELAKALEDVMENNVDDGGSPLPSSQATSSPSHAQSLLEQYMDHL